MQACTLAHGHLDWIIRLDTGVAMYKGLSEIVVLRPTTVFFLFLVSQLPEKHRPSLKTLHTNNTAYIIKKYQTKKETLEELEGCYLHMFRHEICRWLGKDARNEIENKSLDFLCCFKLEFHSHLILLEPSLQRGQYMLQLKPRSALLDWLNSVAEEHLAKSATLPQITENATVLIKHFKALHEVKSFLKDYYKYLFPTVMSRFSNQTLQWPKIHSFQEFSNYFSVEIHTQLISCTS
jgi:hypothetical protein